MSRECTPLNSDFFKENKERIIKDIIKHHELYEVIEIAGEKYLLSKKAYVQYLKEELEKIHEKAEDLLKKIDKLDKRITGGVESIKIDEFKFPPTASNVYDILGKLNEVDDFMEWIEKKYPTLSDVKEDEESIWNFSPK